MILWRCSPARHFIESAFFFSLSLFFLSLIFLSGLSLQITGEQPVFRLSDAKHPPLHISIQIFHPYHSPIPIRDREKGMCGITDDEFSAAGQQGCCRRDDSPMGHRPSGL